MLGAASIAYVRKSEGDEFRQRHFVGLGDIDNLAIHIVEVCPRR
jgi:hypothetical protein